MSENITTRKDAIKALDKTLDLMRTSSKWYRDTDILNFTGTLGIILTLDEMLIVLEKLSNDKHIEYKEAFKRYR